MTRRAGHLGRIPTTADTPIGPAQFDDTTLRRYTKHARRAVEDCDDGDTPGVNPDTARARLAAAEHEQNLRAALRYSWRAVDGGCDSYTEFMAAGGLPAVAAGAGLPPGYGLAVLLDRAMFLTGCRHVIAWPDTDAAGSVPPGRRSLLSPEPDPTARTETRR